jgi:hypothetical protein
MFVSFIIRLASNESCIDINGCMYCTNLENPMPEVITLSERKKYRNLALQVGGGGV